MAQSYYQELSINTVELDVSNPRIKMFLEGYNRELKAEDIAMALKGPSSDGPFQALKESISVNGGVINPILVNHTSDGRYVVIEGNTRLQIYKDFNKSDPEGPWATIRSIVYEQLTDEEIHSIRLQSHLVGPRDWDPYSKAKYLDDLMNKQHLPMSVIISYCGGKKAQILGLVAAYHDMQNYYVPKVKELGYFFDYKDFSKFEEFQRKGVKTILSQNGFTAENFAEWVINGNIDTAQNVRQLPAILGNPEARKVFLKSNITEAMKAVAISTAKIDLTKIDYIELCNALAKKLDNFELKEAKLLQSSKGATKKAALLFLKQNIDMVLGEDEEDTEEDEEE